MCRSRSLSIARSGSFLVALLAAGTARAQLHCDPHVGSPPPGQSLLYVAVVGVHPGGRCQVETERASVRYRPRGERQPFAAANESRCFTVLAPAGAPLQLQCQALGFLPSGPRLDPAEWHGRYQSPEAPYACEVFPIFELKKYVRADCSLERAAFVAENERGSYLKWIASAATAANERGDHGAVATWASAADVRPGLLEREVLRTYAGATCGAECIDEVKLAKAPPKVRAWLADPKRREQIAAEDQRDAVAARVQRVVTAPAKAGDAMAALVAQEILRDPSPRASVPTASGGWRDLEGEAKHKLPRVAPRDVAKAVKLIEANAIERIP